MRLYVKHYISLSLQQRHKPVMESLRSLLERGRGSSFADIRVLRDCPRLWGTGLTRSAIVISILRVCLVCRDCRLL
jgi:hypothetical protein